VRPTAPAVVATTMLVLEANVAAPKVLLEAAKLVVEPAVEADVELVPVALVEVPAKLENRKVLNDSRGQ
jgi:hypothetical protein